MKLDLDLVRNILLDIQDKETLNGYKGNPKVEGYTPEQIEYHVRLMDKRGLLKAVFTKQGYAISGLTWEGHEFIALSKNDKIWEKTKSKTVEKGISITLDIAMKLLSKFTATALGLSD